MKRLCNSCWAGVASMAGRARKYKYFIPIMIVFVTLAQAYPFGFIKAVAGECYEGIEVYIERLEIGANKDYRLVTKYDAELWRETLSWREAFQCLAYGCIPKNGTRWAGPIAAERYKECKSSPYCDRIAAACLSYMEDTTSYFGYFEPRFHSARLLAYYGFNKLEGYDLFSILTSSWRSSSNVRRIDFFALAAMQDSRAALFLEEIYDTLITSTPVYYKEYLVRILNCLYHVPGDTAIELAKRIYENEADELLKERAYKVIVRKLPGKS